ncbi:MULTISPECIES: ribonucleotide reductase subunit alpha [unclassified Pseudoalteromonas]|uniref:ribonucleotide reductase subunit alpha n=1 Tax=unclassified Pseudoalteromonas TaxID=194690 RepID=UPI000CF6486D|nr:MULTISPECIES: ribonucleotide reductase subunit alpha [unclassified Pseudoalteromonas]MBS3798044.1 ribonucleotide reductase subunit alpha [Pseudoalteromonas sp. BDTF-M6]
MISQFSDLLSYAKEQPDPQRLLFLFAKAEQSNKSKKNARGTLTPTMCVDKLPSEIEDFSSLCQEADGISAQWDFMLIASLSGVLGKAPSSEDAEPYLNKMTNDLVSGQNIANYVIFDRQQNPIEMHAN